MAAVSAEDLVQIEFNRGAIGKAFKKDQPAIMEHVLAMSKIDAVTLQQQLTETGNYTIGMRCPSPYRVATPPFALLPVRLHVGVLLLKATHFLWSDRPHGRCSIRIVCAYSSGLSSGEARSVTAEMIKVKVHTTSIFVNHIHIWGAVFTLWPDAFLEFLCHFRIGFYQYLQKVFCVIRRSRCFLLGAALCNCRLC